MEARTVQQSPTEWLESPAEWLGGLPQGPSAAASSAGDAARGEISAPPQQLHSAPRVGGKLGAPPGVEQVPLGGVVDAAPDVGEDRHARLAGEPAPQLPLPPPPAAKHDADVELGENSDEITLGLCTTCVVCVVLYAFLMTWTWRSSWGHEPPPPLITLVDFRRRMERGGYSTSVDGFSLMDMDKDGSVDLEQFANAAQGYRRPLNGSEAEYAFRRFDCDADARVSFTEFNRSLSYEQFEEGFAAGCMPTLDEFKIRLGDASSVLGGAGGGPMDSEAFADAARGFAPPLTRKEARHCFRQLDRDRDSGVSAAEIGESLRFGGWGQGPPTETSTTTTTTAASTSTSPAPTSAAATTTSSGLASTSASTTVAASASRTAAATTKRRAVFVHVDMTTSSSARPASEAAGTTTQTTPSASPSLLSDYKRHLGGRGQIAAVQVDIAQIDSGKITSLGVLEDLGSSVVRSLAAAADVDASAIIDLDGRAGSVSASRMDHVVMDCRIEVPSGTCVQTIVAALKSGGARRGMMDRAAAVPGIQEAIEGTPSPSSIVMTVGESSKDGFFSLDTDFDGVLDEGEFVAASATFLVPPLTGEQARIYFPSLDANHDQRLDSDEFFACQIKDAGPAELTPPSPLSLFVQRLRTKFRTADQAFLSIDGNSDGSTDYAEFISGNQRLSPPMTPAMTEQAFKKLDADDNGQVTRIEFDGAFKEKHQQAYDDESY